MPPSIPVNPQRGSHVTGANHTQQVKKVRAFGLFLGRKVAITPGKKMMPRGIGKHRKPTFSLKKANITPKKQANLVNRQKLTGNTNLTNSKPNNLKQLEQENRSRTLDLPDAPKHKPGTNPSITNLTTYRALSERLAETTDLGELVAINNHSTQLAISGKISPQEFSSIKTLTPSALKKLANIPSENRRMNTALLKKLVPDTKQRVALIQQIRHQRTIHNISDRLKNLRQG